MLTQSFSYLLSCILMFFVTTQNKPGCFKLKPGSRFIIGEKLDINALQIEYGVDEGGDNFGKNNGFADYGSTDSSISIKVKDGQIHGALTFTIEKKTQKLTSIFCIWVFLIRDDKTARSTGLKEIKSKFLNCLQIEKFDVQRFCEYTEKKNNYTETFTFRPGGRREDGTDVSYSMFYYSIK